MIVAQPRCGGHVVSHTLSMRHAQAEVICMHAIEVRPLMATLSCEGLVRYAPPFNHLHMMQPAAMPVLYCTRMHLYAHMPMHAVRLLSADIESHRAFMRSSVSC